MTQPQDVIDAIQTPKDLSDFLSDPKAYTQSKGLDPEDPAVAGAMELYARSLSEQINGVNRTVGSSDIHIEWGIGAGCCNAKILKRMGKG